MAETVEELRNELVAQMARGYLADDDANPDVGMGLFPFAALNRALEVKGYSKADVDYDAILEQLKAERRRR